MENYLLLTVLFTELTVRCESKGEDFSDRKYQRINSNLYKNSLSLQIAILVPSKKGK